eukprot:CAMPEP_0185365220 /NCGR_PEP_ID=MMETSP1364-20130426/12916_1 /TAXON_ID=38817 /ORGANISM="Gephyrocapsa oceanica, Strain RCC1303" /LENGTH=61 /DNA_ID=CAMNT_0027965749 /DNA_START=40 /DNA_END=221 /DNA_ORIENTATION=+
MVPRGGRREAGGGENAATVLWRRIRDSVEVDISSRLSWKRSPPLPLPSAIGAAASGTTCSS